MTRGTQFFHLQDGSPYPTGSHIWARAAGDGRAPLAEGLPGVGRASETRSRRRVGGLQAWLSSDPLPGFPSPFSSNSWAGGFTCRARPPEVAQTLCYLSPGGPGWRAQSGGQDAARYVRTGAWAPGRGRGCPGTSPSSSGRRGPGRNSPSGLDEAVGIMPSAPSF